MAVDHYNTLGVVASASAADLRAAYLRLARAHHPDKFAGAERVKAEARMQEINEAWNVLGVAHKRREYDAATTRAGSPNGQSRRGSVPGSSPRGSAARGNAHFRPFDDDPIDRADIDLDPTPIAGSRNISRLATFLPIILVMMGVLTAAFGTLVDAAGVFALGLVCLALGGVCFLMLPLVVMSRAERDPDV